MFETIIDHDFIKNIGYSTEAVAEIETANIKDCYLTIMGYVEKSTYGQPSIEKVEDYINLGYYEYTDKNGYTGKIDCPIETLVDRVYLFKAAQAKQFIFDDVNGRSAMTSGEETICPDAITRLKQLGLLRTSFSDLY